MIKLPSLALAALLATAAAASAATNAAAPQGRIFSNGLSADGHGESHLEFGRVDAAAAGVIEVYEVRFGQVGRLVATEDVDAGTNWDVRIPVGSRRHTDMLAVLKVDGEAVSQRFVGDID